MKIVFFLSLFCVFASAIEIEPWDKTYERFKKELGDDDKKTVKSVKDAPDRTIGFEALSVTEGEFSMASRILADFESYPKWLLKNINIKRSTGGTYYFQILDLRLTDKKEGKVHGKFYFNFPIFKQSFERDFITKFTKESDKCFLMTAESLADKASPIRSAEGSIRVCAPPTRTDRIWIQFKGRTSFQDGILFGIVYTLLPRNMLANEVGDRLGIIMENYLLEEDRVWRELKAAKGATATPLPK